MVDLSDEITPLVRTWFGDDAAWGSLLEAVATPTTDGFIANVDVIDDRSLDGATPSAVAELMPYRSEYTVAILADQLSMTAPEQPLLVVQADITDTPATLRVIASELYGIENNMSLANMEWNDFADHADEDGVFRGNF